MPGMLCDAALWDDVRSVFTGPIVEVVPDVPTITGMAKQVLAAVDGPFALVGLSLGAIVGFEVCRRAPKRVIALAACSTNAGAPRPEQLTGWTAADRMVAQGLFEQVIDQTVLPGMFHTREPSALLEHRFRAMARRVGPERFRAQLAAQATRNSALDALAHYGGPVLALSGTADVLCPLAFHQAITTAAPRGQLITIPGGGHLLPWDQPRATRAALADWYVTATEVHQGTQA
ncbi:alpha/beta hydrolase [Streptomyces longwoodensis]|uniref:alpha/beta fold hydrolase n=1 Tax=Streptomyces longwoodensis TaxID=68231 RepID=UPI0033D4AC7E